MVGRSSSRRAVSHRERSQSRARLRRVADAMAQAPPLTLIFPGKASAPIGRTDPTRLELQGAVASSEDNRPAHAIPLRAIPGRWSHASVSCGRASGARRKERRRKRHVRISGCGKSGLPGQFNSAAGAYEYGRGPLLASAEGKKARLATPSMPATRTTPRRSRACRDSSASRWS